MTTPCEEAGYTVGKLCIVNSFHTAPADIRTNRNIPGGSLVRIVYDDEDQVPVVEVVIPAGAMPESQFDAEDYEHFGIPLTSGPLFFASIHRMTLVEDTNDSEQ